MPAPSNTRTSSPMLDVLLHRDDVGARHHDVADSALAQTQDVLEHPAFFRREAGFAGRS